MKHEKQLLLEEVKQQIVKRPSFAIMSYERIPANKANAFRREVQKLGGHVEVLRKRVLVKAAEAAGVNLSVEALPGHIGLVFAGEDPFETTKALFNFAKESDKNVKVVGGRFDGKLYNGEQIEMLSKLPGKDEMRAQLLATLEAPLSQTLAVMEALLSSVVYCLDNKSKQESSTN
jgi:large subunit ribosomal protein L10